MNMQKKYIDICEYKTAESVLDNFYGKAILNINTHILNIF